MSHDGASAPPDRRAFLRPIWGWGLLLAGILTIQSVAARPFYIPSASMMPALEEGDRLIASKYPYGWSWVSPVIRVTGPVPGRLMGKLPERGDIVIVARRSDGADLIKRVIGLPGDTIAVRDGIVVLNGTPVPREARGPARIAIDPNVPCDAPDLARFRFRGADAREYCGVPVYRETLPNGARYDTIDLGRGYEGDRFGPIAVPENHLFLMGDNRDQSADSRFALSRGGLGGPVPFETIGGRAEFITYSVDGSGRWINPVSWFTAMRGDRAAESLRPVR